MKTSIKLFIAVLGASCVLPAIAQVQKIPPSRQVKPSANNSDVVPDGITVYHGQTFLLLNGRAALVNAKLVPEGTVLTRAGRLVPMPPELTGRAESRTQITPRATSDAVQDGIVLVKGKSYMVRGLSLLPINAQVIPEGLVLNTANRLSPLPSDFSGFNLERTPNGLSTLPIRNDNSQALSRQAGVPQMVARFTPSPSVMTGPNSSPKLASAGSVRTGNSGGYRGGNAMVKPSNAATTMRATTLSKTTPVRKYVPMTVQDAPPAALGADIPVQMPLRTDFRGESINPLLPAPPVGWEIPAPNLPPSPGDSTGTPGSIGADIAPPSAKEN